MSKQSHKYLHQCVTCKKCKFNVIHLQLKVRTRWKRKCRFGLNRPPKNCKVKQIVVCLLYLPKRYFQITRIKNLRIPNSMKQKKIQTLCSSQIIYRITIIYQRNLAVHTILGQNCFLPKVLIHLKEISNRVLSIIEKSEIKGLVRKAILDVH